MGETTYVYLRTLELEGRYPQDAGAWPITVRRMEAGEGTPSINDPAHLVEISDEGVMPPVPTPDRANWNRSIYYKRLNTTSQVESCLKSRFVDPGGQFTHRWAWVQVALKLFPNWIDPPGGIVPLPKEGECPLEMTHAVPLDAFNKSKCKLGFRNSWGKEWGSKGWGCIDYDYFDKFVFESWGAYSDGHFLRRRIVQLTSEQPIEEWTIEDERGLRTYGFNLTGQSVQGRIGWCFVVNRGDAFDIEELYIRPEFRGKRLGSQLAEHVAKFLGGRNKLVRLWVPFADCRSEAPDNYGRLAATVHKLGLGFHKCPMATAAYFATNDRSYGPGSNLPVEPDFIPQRPKGMLASLIVAAGLARSAEPAIAIKSPIVSENYIDSSPIEAGERNETNFPAIGSEAWDQMNQRRNVLIRKKVVEGIEALTASERQEYEWLQRMSLRAIQEKYPTPMPLQQELAKLRETLKAGNPAN